jgi:peptidoglycan/LPS O-acetylase OafA/YrhL
LTRLIGGTRPNNRFSDRLQPNPFVSKCFWVAQQLEDNLGVQKPAAKTHALGHNFRPEIAGLRAVAVVAVILFHLKFQAFSGGFMGVDVFFVISGYLITGNILRDVREDRFSLVRFYVRRTKRIYPALIATVVATYVLGAIWCSPLMFLDLAKECTHALLSISNIQYWRESHKYFAANSDELAMLHCWSLSLEEQFYLVWPVFLLLAHKLGRTLPAILAATIASILGAILMSSVDSSAAFFLMPFRIFEFGCGAITLYLENLPRKQTVNLVLSVAGPGAILASVLFLRSDLPHLEIFSLIPSVGAAAVILSGSKAGAGRLLGHPLAVAIGAISYSLYLCHWPIIFFARFIFGPAANSLIGIILMIAGMFLTATIMYRFVERPFTRPAGAVPDNFWRYSAAFWSVVLSLVAITHSTFLLKGLPWRLPSEQAELAHLQEFSSGKDVLVDPDIPLGLHLLGDSYAVQYMAGLSVLAHQLGIGMEISAKPGCPMLYGVTLKSSRRQECAIARDLAFERAAHSALPVIFAQRWDFYDDATIEIDDNDSPATASQPQSYVKLESALAKTLEELLRQRRRVLLVGSQVEAGCTINLARILPGPLTHAPQMPCPTIERFNAETAGKPYNDMLLRIQSQWPDRVELFRPVDYFCDDECPTVQDGISLYYESKHFSVAGSRYIVTRAKNLIANFITSKAGTGSVKALSP